MQPNRFALRLKKELWLAAWAVWAAWTSKKSALNCRSELRKAAFGRSFLFECFIHHFLNLARV
jgi:hypothetical protein